MPLYSPPSLPYWTEDQTLTADSVTTSTAWINIFSTNTLTAGVAYEFDLTMFGIPVAINGTDHTLEMLALSTTFAVGSWYVYTAAEMGITVFNEYRVTSATSPLISLSAGYTSGLSRSIQGVFTLTADSVVRLRHRLSATDSATILKHARFRLKALP